MTEVIEDVIARQRVAFVAAISAIAFGFLQQALKLQRSENDRRLSDLNNEGSRLAAAVAANVSADTWKGFFETYSQDQQRQSDRMDRIQNIQNKMIGALILSSIFVPGLISFAVYLLTRHAVPISKP